jgi:hypothetical protein
MAKVKKEKIDKESTQFDDFVGKKAERDEKSVFDLLGIEPPDNQDKEWKKHWKGMPEFEQNDNPTYKTLYLHFRNKQDFDEFCERYHKMMDEEQKITFKTKSMWYPHLDREANSLLRWIEKE